MHAYDLFVIKMRSALREEASPHTTTNQHLALSVEAKLMHTLYVLHYATINAPV